jgi:hypothetical protein
LTPFNIQYETFDNFFYYRLAKILKKHPNQNLYYILDDLPEIDKKYNMDKKNGILFKNNETIIFSILNTKYNENNPYLVVSYKKNEITVSNNIFRICFVFGIFSLITFCKLNI